MPTTTTTTTPRTWWRWDQVPAGVLVALDIESPCPACAAPLHVTRDDHDAQDVECTACAWAQGFAQAFVWARRP